MRTEKMPTDIRKEQIVEAALTILSDNAAPKLKMSDVARQLGLAPSALYRHFKNRDAMLSAILEHIRTMLHTNLEQVRQQTDNAVERLHAMLVRHGRLIREQQAIPRIVFSDEIWGQKRERRQRMYRIVTGYLAEIEAIVVEGQARGEIRLDVEARVVAKMFFGIVQPAALLWYMSEGCFDLESHINDAWTLLVETVVRR